MLVGMRKEKHFTEHLRWNRGNSNRTVVREVVRELDVNIECPEKPVNDSPKVNPGYAGILALLVYSLPSPSFRTHLCLRMCHR